MPHVARRAESVDFRAGSVGSSEVIFAPAALWKPTSGHGCCSTALAHSSEGRESTRFLSRTRHLLHQPSCAPQQNLTAHVRVGHWRRTDGVRTLSPCPLYLRSLPNLYAVAPAGLGLVYELPHLRSRKTLFCDGHHIARSATSLVSWSSTTEGVSDAPIQHSRSHRICPGWLNRMGCRKKSIGSWHSYLCSQHLPSFVDIDRPRLADSARCRLFARVRISKA
jgi:hypothetical protein